MNRLRVYVGILSLNTLTEIPQFIAECAKHTNHYQKPPSSKGYCNECTWPRGVATTILLCQQSFPFSHEVVHLPARLKFISYKTVFSNVVHACIFLTHSIQLKLTRDGYIDLDLPTRYTAWSLHRETIYNG